MVKWDERLSSGRGEMPGRGGEDCVSLARGGASARAGGLKLVRSRLRWGRSGPGGFGSRGVLVLTGDDEREIARDGTCSRVGAGGR
uniref:DUF397 domain-containing protein n=1 Tax=Knipowitschia caucasica TaxID=637954 RepID=A0AAV2MJY5_KNICA